MAERYHNSGVQVRIPATFMSWPIGDRWFLCASSTPMWRLKMSGWKIYRGGKQQGYIRDIVLNPELVRREFRHLDVEVEKEGDSFNAAETY